MKHRKETVAYSEARERWYESCDKAADDIISSIPDKYSRRSFAGLIGDVKALSSQKARRLFDRKSGLGVQYAHQYLTTGIGHGRGYQACAAEAISAFIGQIGRPVLDVGCAVGVTAGVLGLEEVHGFDLFEDLLQAAYVVNGYMAKEKIEIHHHYVCADMTIPWPYSGGYSSVTAFLVCHHLDDAIEAGEFFLSANRVLVDGGRLFITLPSRSIVSFDVLRKVCNGLEAFGFEIEEDLTGLIRSDDEPHSLFWMFLITAQKRGSINNTSKRCFIDDSFGFSQLKTPENREVKGARVRESARRNRKVRHRSFELLLLRDMEQIAHSVQLIYPHVVAL